MQPSKSPLVDTFNILHTPPHLKRVFKFKSEQREFKIEEDSIFPRLKKKLGVTFVEEGERKLCPRKEQARMFREEGGEGNRLNEHCVALESAASAIARRAWKGMQSSLYK